MKAQGFPPDVEIQIESTKKELRARAEAGRKRSTKLNYK